MKTTLARKIFCITAMLCAAAWSANANLVADPGFEASADGLGPHPFSVSWSNTDPSGFGGVGGDSEFAHSGDNYAFLGTGGSTSVLGQDLSAGLVVGQSYNISFWLANDMTAGLPPGNSFQVSFDGAIVFSLTNQAAFGYTQFTISNLVYDGVNSSLDFIYSHSNDFWRLDDIDVSAAGVTESFSTIWLGLPAFGALGFLQFSRGRTRKSLAGC